MGLAQLRGPHWAPEEQGQEFTGFDYCQGYFFLFLSYALPGKSTPGLGRLLSTLKEPSLCKDGPVETLYPSVSLGLFEEEHEQARGEGLAYVSLL